MARPKTSGTKKSDPRVRLTAKNRRIVGLIVRRLERTYRSPRLGNPQNPLGDLVFIILSGRTHGRVHARVYRELKRRFPSWKTVAGLKVPALTDLIRDAGLAEKKAHQISSLLRRLSKCFGRPTLSPLKRMSDRHAEEFLVSLPGVGVKTARCVLMYTLGRKVFPVDTHVRRICSYFGLVNPHVRLEYAQDALQELIPPRYRYSLHVNLVAHGRTLCVPNVPACTLCPLSDVCPHSKGSKRKP